MTVSDCTYAHVDHHGEFRVDHAHEVRTARRQLLDRPVVQEHEVVHHLEPHQRQPLAGNQLQHATQPHEFLHFLDAQRVHVRRGVVAAGGRRVEVHAESSRVALAVLTVKGRQRKHLVVLVELHHREKLPVGPFRLLVDQAAEVGVDRVQNQVVFAVALGEVRAVLVAALLDDVDPLLDLAVSRRMESNLVEDGLQRLDVVLVDLHLVSRRLVFAGARDVVENALFVAASQHRHAVEEALVEVKVVRLQKGNGVGLV